MQDFERLLDIARRKAGFDESNPWYTGPETYLYPSYLKLQP